MERQIFHFLDEVRDLYRSRRDVLCDGLTRAGWNVPRPPATMFVWAEIPEEWKERGNPGPAPDWFLGDDDSWCHWAFVKVERISDYKPPPDEEPKYGIVTSSFHAG